MFIVYGPFINIHSLPLQGRWGRGGASVTGRPAAWTAVRSCAAVEATTRRGSAGARSASASSTGAAPCAAATVSSRWTCTPVKTRRDRPIKLGEICACFFTACAY